MNDDGSQDQLDAAESVLDGRIRLGPDLHYAALAKTFGFFGRCRRFPRRSVLSKLDTLSPASLMLTPFLQDRFHA